MYIGSSGSRRKGNQVFEFSNLRSQAPHQRRGKQQDKISSRIDSIWVCFVEGVAGGSELVHHHVAKIREVFESFSQNLVDVDAVWL